MRRLATVLIILTVISGFYGIYNEFATEEWPFRTIPKGTALGLALTSFTMMFTLLVVEKERSDRLNERKSLQELIDQLAPRLSIALPSHERHFYALWSAQLLTAQNNVDVTHLGPRPPQHRHGEPEREYFENLRGIYSNSRASIRRVERLTS